MNDKIYPSMVIRIQAEAIELLKKENAELQQELTKYKEKSKMIIEYIKELDELESRNGDYSISKYVRKEILSILEDKEKK